MQRHIECPWGVLNLCGYARTWSAEDMCMHCVCVSCAIYCDVCGHVVYVMHMCNGVWCICINMCSWCVWYGMITQCVVVCLCVHAGGIQYLMCYCVSWCVHMHMYLRYMYVPMWFVMGVYKHECLYICMWYGIISICDVAYVYMVWYIFMHTVVHIHMCIVMWYNIWIPLNTWLVSCACVQKRLWYVCLYACMCIICCTCVFIFMVYGIIYMHTMFAHVDVYVCVLSSHICFIMCTCVCACGVRCVCILSVDTCWSYVWYGVYAPVWCLYGLIIFGTCV